MTLSIRYEQAVYGSFPFWDQGYAVLARSPGCRPEWLAALRAACQEYGERPPGVAEAGGLFALRLACGPWAIIGPSAQGRDDQWRPGALAFHALFLGERDYRRSGADPFAFAGALRSEWTGETRELPAGVWGVAPPGPPAPTIDGRAARIVSALARGRRVALEADGPSDDLARQVWRALPEKVRARASVATWAFGNGNRFDFVALPRLGGVELDFSYVDPHELDNSGPLAPRERVRVRGALRNRLPIWSRAPDPAPLPRGEGEKGSDRARRFAHPLHYLGAGAILSGALVGLALHGGHGAIRPTSAVALAHAPVPDRAPPDPSAYRDDPPDPEEHRRVAEALVDMAERFGVLDVESVPCAADPKALMILLDRRLRYRGPFLTDAELAGLAHDRRPASQRDRALALGWHARVRRFADDRALPEGFARGPLRWQLDTLAWSFHLDDPPDAPRRSAAEVPHALAEALAVDVPLRASPLTAHYPVLATYVEFLGRLPRR